MHGSFISLGKQGLSDFITNICWDLMQKGEPLPFFDSQKVSLKKKITATFVVKIELKL